MVNKMSGIFGIMNHPGTGESEVTLPQSFFDGLFLMYVAGVRTPQQLRDVAETALGRSLTSEEASDLLDVANYIASGSGESGKIARLHRFNAVAGIWETGQGGITEAEARTMTGVIFS